MQRIKSSEYIYIRKIKRETIERTIDLIDPKKKKLTSNRRSRRGYSSERINHPSITSIRGVPEIGVTPENSDAPSYRNVFGNLNRRQLRGRNRIISA